jgi:transcriptional regulator with XRE-family HTH domain
VAAHVDVLTEAALTQIEEGSDQASNPSLMQLRQIAVILKTTVADLVEPDMGGRVVGFLNEWLDGRQAARYSGISQKDSRKIMRRMLLRVIDSLEKD